TRDIVEPYELERRRRRGRHPPSVRVERRHPERREPDKLVLGCAEGGKPRGVVAAQARTVRQCHGCAGVQLYGPGNHLHRRPESLVALANAARSAIFVEIATVPRTSMWKGPETSGPFCPSSP